MTEVKFYETVDDELLKFAVIIAKHDDQWGFCKHREAGEQILVTAKRELQEETGALVEEAVRRGVIEKSIVSCL